MLFLVACSGNAANRESVLAPREGLVEDPVFNGEVYFKMQGNQSGPVVFLVHGLDNNASKLWAQTVENLESEYLTVTLDLPGFGQSSKANELYSPENYARLINHLAQTYIGRPFHLIGHSMGGAISLRYAATYPDDVLSLTLVDAAGILHRLAYTKYLAPLGLKPIVGLINLDKNDVTSLAGLILNKADSYLNIDPKILIQSALLRSRVLQGNPRLISGMALVMDDFSTIPQTVTAPTQIIWGENDEIAPLRTGHVLNRLLPDAELYVMDDTGHSPMLENPDEFYRLLNNFLQSTQPASNTQHTESTDQKTVNCIDKNNLTYTGTMTGLIISNCKNVSIKNARLKQLFIKNSRVYLENVQINSPAVALTAVNSDVLITAGEIEGEVAIETDQSHLDIAGTKLSGKQNVITTTSVNPTSAVFSLTPAFDAQGHKKMLHGRHSITTEVNILYD